MVYKLLDMAQARWRRLDGAHLLPLVRAGIVWIDGMQEPRQASRYPIRIARAAKTTGQPTGYERSP
jgi:hypothetical protein